MFKETAPGLIPDNAFKLIGKDWRLITAGSPEPLTPDRELGRVG